MKYLITGGCGFLGSNLAAEVLNRGEELIIFDNLYRFGAIENLNWLMTLGKFKFIHSDIRNNNDVEKAIKDIRPEVIFHLAGQVSMTASINNPRFDFEVNVLGTINLLEAIRKYSPESIVIYSSTNKVYGNLQWVRYKENETRYFTPDFPNGFSETIPLDFQTPYGCSKGAADQYMVDYARIFGLRTVVFRHSSIYGTRQFATYDQGWIGWFVRKALEIKNGKLREPITISGNGKQVRDVLFISDCIELYFNAVKVIDKIKGQVFNIGGGKDNSLSLLELFDFLEKQLEIKITFTQLPPRISDQKVFIADITKAKELIGFRPKIPKEDGIKKVIEWISETIF